MAKLFPNGIGASLGDSLVTCKPLFTSSNVWYVHAETGTDASGFAGKNREKPLATIAQAVTNAADGDIISMLSGHEETLTAVVAVSKRLIIVGEGSSEGNPTVKLKNNQASGRMFTFSAARCQLRNVWLEENEVANPSSRIQVSASDFQMVGCLVDCGANDDEASVELASGADRPRFGSCTFNVTATDVDDQPYAGIVATAAIVGLTLDGVVFNAGTVGFWNDYAVDLSAGAITDLRGESVSLLNGADMLIHASSTGYLNVQTSTGSGRVEW